MFIFTTSKNTLFSKNSWEDSHEFDISLLQSTLSLPIVTLKFHVISKLKQQIFQSLGTKFLSLFRLKEWLKYIEEECIV